MNGHDLCRGKLKQRVFGGGERVEGIEPSWPVWKTGTLPLSYTRESENNLTGVRAFDKCFLLRNGNEGRKLFNWRAQGRWVASFFVLLLLFDF